MITESQAIPGSFLSWVHFGDLHIQNAYDENHLDFLELIDEVNEHLTGDVDFAFLPGDNADGAEEEQYQLVRSALNRLNIPVQVITGDHDRKSGTLNLFKRYLQADVYRAVNLKTFRLLFLNAMDGHAPKDFDFSSEQVKWLAEQLRDARSEGLVPLIFTHLYPSELQTQGKAFSSLIKEFQVPLVEMGHTHYNELSNDGLTIYTATRSTGQIEEGPPGFSLTAIDGDVVSWKFKERGPWPFAMITLPAEEKLITRPESVNHVIRGRIPIRAKVWGSIPIQNVMCSVDDSPSQAMQFAHGYWELTWNSESVSDCTHRIAVQVIGDGHEARDEIVVLVNQAGRYTPPKRSGVDYENAIGAYPGKCILGTELGPNEKGIKGPWPAWRGK